MIKHKLLTLFVALVATTALWAQNNVITYTASGKLPEIDSNSRRGGGLQINAFDVKIISHTFSNGMGTITFAGDVSEIGNYAFESCYDLTSITIPNSVTTIGRRAFFRCTGLISITLPDSVKHIGIFRPDFETFYQVNNIVCNNPTLLRKDDYDTHWGAKCVNGYVDGYLVYIDSTKTKLCGCSTAATGEIIIPNTVTTIGEGAFNGCSGLTSVMIPNSVSFIGSHAFSGCTSLPIIGNIRYADTYLVEVVNKDSFVYTIKEGTKWIGDGAFQNCFNMTSVTFPNSVITIGEEAFSSCSGLTSVTIPNSVTTIGDNAFGACNGLTSPIYNVNSFAYMPTLHEGMYAIPNGITQIAGGAFSGCEGLTSVIIPNSVTTIEDFAFYGCSGLTSVTIPNSVTTIGSNAFYDCSGLTSITIPCSIKEIGNCAFYGCDSLISVTINSNSIVDQTFTYSNRNMGDMFGKQVKAYYLGHTVTSIRANAFSDCDSLTSITIPSSVTMIGENAFSEYRNLVKINFTGTVADWCKIKFGNYNANPMHNNYNFCINGVEVKNLVIPQGVDTIESYAFYDCSGLTSVTIPNSVTSIGDGAFVNCTGLTSVTIPNSVTTIGDYAFERVNNIVYHGTATWSSEDYHEYWGAKCMNGYVAGFLVYSDSTKTKICGCSTAAKGKIIIPKSVTTIGEDAFSLCTDLTSIVLHTSIEKIEAGAFYWCTNLKSITIPRSVTTIGDWAFGGCSNLVSVTFAKGSLLTTIGKSAFYGCSKLSSMTLPKSIITIGDNAFEDTPFDK